MSNKNGANAPEDVRHATRKKPIQIARFIPLKMTISCMKSTASLSASQQPECATLVRPTKVIHNVPSSSRHGSKGSDRNRQSPGLKEQLASIAGNTAFVRIEVHRLHAQFCYDLEHRIDSL